MSHCRCAPAPIDPQRGGAALWGAAALAWLAGIGAQLQQGGLWPLAHYLALGAVVGIWVLGLVTGVSGVA